ncbi:MAG: ATP-binding protein [Archangium sp.]|nr:ATP-binding protein [Archangium sp.]MDP3155268.1 ATP-binding protein [Archangium sp.]MDP3570929.1 ATP-binding protein [Archangium sp.]
MDRLLGDAARGLDPQELRVARLTAAFSIALSMWGPLFAVFYGLMGAFRLSLFVVLAVAVVGTSLIALRAGKRVLAGHQLLLGLLGVLLAIGAYTRGVFSPTLMWLPVLPVIALLLLGRRAALIWGAVPIAAVILFTVAAFMGIEGAGVFSGKHLIAYHAASLLSTVVLQASLALLFESAKAQMGEELAAQRDLVTRAEERSRMKSDFLASTSHELRTPLNTIINIPQGLLDILAAPRAVRCAGCSELFELEEAEAVPAQCPSCGGALALQPAPELEPATTSRLLRSVVTSGQHLLMVVNDILDYSRLEARGQVLARESTALEQVLQQLEGVIAPVAQRAGVGLVLQRDAAPTTQLSVDRVKLAQVLINLVSNAIKFSNGQGEVRVIASTFEEAGHGWVQLLVRDQGIGIAPENLSVIFEGFRQVDQGPSRKYGGTGLGLAISKRLVELHGGRLKVESALGRGSTFRVQLPITQSHSQRGTS